MRRLPLSVPWGVAGPTGAVERIDALVTGAFEPLNAAAGVSGPLGAVKPMALQTSGFTGGACGAVLGGDKDGLGDLGGGHPPGETATVSDHRPSNALSGSSVGGDGDALGTSSPRAGARSGVGRTIGSRCGEGPCAEGACATGKVCGTGISPLGRQSANLSSICLCKSCVSSQDAASLNCDGGLILSPSFSDGGFIPSRWRS
mmetsp:Transcript_101055/g.216465  ORF Transcript_101055/g.216465 Transcript_101055/m.216465 type:complete len:202 (-) Transcript_101055:821-1426(-)